MAFILLIKISQMAEKRKNHSESDQTSNGLSDELTDKLSGPEIKTKKQCTDKNIIPERLSFHDQYGDMVELKKWISELDDETIRTNNVIAAEFLKTNQNMTRISACGLTSQAVMNLLMDRNGKKISDLMSKRKWWDDDLIQGHNIISVRMFACTCCHFPGHAFVIYCSGDMCLILQSFVGVYTIRDFFDVMSNDKVNKFVNIFLNMYIHGIDDDAIRQLTKFTHVCFNKYRDCRLKDSFFEVIYHKNDTMFRYKS
jgi:hypothetical protein